MRRVLVSCLIASLLAVCHCHAQSVWTELNSGTSNGLLGVFFIDESRGYAVGDLGTILRTTDGGSLWTPVDIPTQVSLWGIYAAAGKDGDIIYVAGDDGAVYKTMNGGQNWTKQDVHYTQGFTFGIYCSDPSTCFVAGGEGPFGSNIGTIVRTENGGDTWTKVTLPGTYSFDKAFSSDGITGYAAGSANSNFSAGIVYKTTDGGKSWAPSLSTPGAMNSVYCFDSEHCIAVGFFGLVYQTTDGGKNWTSISIGYGNSLLHIAFLDHSVGFMSGDNGLVLTTTDGGTIWSKDSYNGSASLWGLSVVAGKAAYAVGDGGTIIKKTVDAVSVGECGGDHSGMFIAQASAENTLRFGIPKPGSVRLELFSLDGRKLLTLVDGTQEAGEHSVNIRVGTVQPGTYLCRLAMGGRSISTIVQIVY